MFFQKPSIYRNGSSNLLIDVFLSAHTVITSISNFIFCQDNKSIMNNNNPHMNDRLSCRSS